jgi:glycosyltransferase involved in cell wall biosynthesis
VELVGRLARLEDTAIVVVNDGSSDRRIFDEIQAIDGVDVLHHDLNQGKGQALKTGFAHLLERPEVDSILTVDADGQHAAADVARVAEAARTDPKALILGVRRFDDATPWKSAIGNRLSRGLLRALYGLRVSDSQTGLRGVPRALAERSLELESGRYGFELEMLLRARQEGIEIAEVPIETIYLDGNRASHFRPILDSVHVYLVFVRFSLMSLVSFLIDISLFTVINSLTGTIFFSTYAARITSGTFNFLGNRNLVFRREQQSALPLEALGYVLLAFSIATASGFLVKALVALLGWNPTLIKLGVDPCLFFVSFLVQRLLIFRR